MKKLTFCWCLFSRVFALGLTGCSDDPDVKQETPVIKASNPADIAAVAGKVTVPYTVDYAVDGCSLDVTWDATWLHDLSVSADKFTLQADANPGAAREAKLTLTYPEATSVELTVRQMSASESIRSVRRPCRSRTRAARRLLPLPVRNPGRWKVAQIGLRRTRRKANLARAS